MSFDFLLNDKEDANSLSAHSAMGNEAPQVVEEEYVYDPSGAKRRVKVSPPPPRSDI